MVEDRDIKRYDVKSTWNGINFNLRLCVIRLWDDLDENYSRFNIQLKINNKSTDKINDDCLEGGNWTVIAHSDHNPNGGHNIYDSTDEKQVHIDIHPRTNNDSYNDIYTRLFNGQPPESNEKVVDFIVEYMIKNSDELLKKYFNYFNTNLDQKSIKM